MDKEFNKGGDGGGKESSSCIPRSRPRSTRTSKAGARSATVEGRNHDLGHGDVVIAAITSCTNTSNPSRDGRRRPAGAQGGGRRASPSSRGSRPRSRRARRWSPNISRNPGLQKDLDKLGYNLVGFGCTTCIGNSGPLAPEISKTINDQDLVAAAVLSGNRNFEGRINADVRANYLASPPLVVAYALAGSMYSDLVKQPLGLDKKGKKVFLKDIWPTSREIDGGHPQDHQQADVRRRNMPTCSRATRIWRKISVKGGLTYAWDKKSTYVQNPPYFVGMGAQSGAAHRHRRCARARAPARIRSPPTTSRRPARSRLDSPAGKYLIDHKVKPVDFNQYGTRRGNHEVMMRGTFANIRLKNQMVPGVEGGVTVHFPSTRADVDLRRRHALQGGEGPARGVRRQGIRLGLVARLGRQGRRTCSASAP